MKTTSGYQLSKKLCTVDGDGLVCMQTEHACLGKQAKNLGIIPMKLGDTAYRQLLKAGLCPIILGNAGERPRVLWLLEDLIAIGKRWEKPPPDPPSEDNPLPPCWWKRDKTKPKFPEPAESDPAKPRTVFTPKPRIQGELFVSAKQFEALDERVKVLEREHCEIQ